MPKVIDVLIRMVIGNERKSASLFASRSFVFPKGVAPPWYSNDEPQWHTWALQLYEVVSRHEDPSGPKRQYNSCFGVPFLSVKDSFPLLDNESKWAGTCLIGLLLYVKRHERTMYNLMYVLLMLTFFIDNISVRFSHTGKAMLMNIW